MWKSQKSHLHCLQYKMCYFTNQKPEKEGVQRWQIWRLGGITEDISFCPVTLSLIPGMFPYGYKVAAGAPPITASPSALKEGELFVMSLFKSGEKFLSKLPNLPTPSHVSLARTVSHAISSTSHWQEMELYDRLGPIRFHPWD